MWWHAAVVKPELVEPEPPSWAYKDPNPLSFDKTVVYGDSAAALRIDVQPPAIELVPPPPPNNFVFGELGQSFNDGRSFQPSTRANGTVIKQPGRLYP